MFNGLSEKEVRISRSRYGSNEIISKNNNSFLNLLVESLGDPIIKILLIALAVKVIFLFKNFDWYETIGILIAIFLASFISSISEYGSNKAFERLQNENKNVKVNVIRNGIVKTIPKNEIVVGDIVKLYSGDKVPADGHIVKGFLYLDESFITGEPKEIYKKNTSQDNKVYSESGIYKGDALILVDFVGEKTFMGSISKELEEMQADSPLKIRLRALAKSISKMGYFGAILASLSYLFMKLFVNNNFDLNLVFQNLKNFPLMMDYLIYCLTLSVTIIIMAVPEGLPMMITLVLSSNMKKMLKDNVLVRKMVGIETSGSLNVLFCDKTGTLTEGILKVTKIVTKEGKFFENIQELDNNIFSKHCKESLFLNNEAIYSNNNIVSGNITDRAILNFVGNINCAEKVVKRKEFSSEDKYSFVKTEKGICYYKGAGEVLLNKCKYYLDSTGKKQPLSDIKTIEKSINQLTSHGYRVLVDTFSESEEMENLTYICSIVISDSLRKNTNKSVQLITNAGIKVVMITGDSKETAKSIGEKAGIFKDGDLIITHDELQKFSDDYLISIKNKISIIARAMPQDKSRLVNVYQKAGLVVGMTGDGINDALALRKSDVGFALGSGCEVAKEASDIVILDDNIMSIYNAILYGRTIFKSIRKFIIYQLTVNVCALFLSVFGVLIGISTPITIIQMLWLNMIMDTFAGLAFSYEPPLEEYMFEKPKRKDEKIMNKYMLNQICVNGISSAIICMLFYKLSLFVSIFRPDQDNAILLTAFFALFIFLGIINSFLARTHRINIFAKITKNKVFLIINIFIFIVQLYIIYNGGDLFRTYGLTVKELGITFLIATLIIPIDFLRKIILKKGTKNIGV